MADNRLPVLFRYRLLWHFLFWIAVFVMYWITYAGYFGRYYEEFILNLIALPARMIGTYAFIYLILPFAIEKKQPVLFGILVPVHAILFGFLVHASFYYSNPLHEFHRYSGNTVLNYSKIFSTTLSNYIVPLAAASIVIFKKWYIDELKNKKLAEEKNRAELKFLKSQIHPHFLFNTLNNLYALSLTRSKKTPDIVLKLSGLLDYMIYESNEKLVPLEKELEIIGSYIELEKMRYNERLDFKYEINGYAAGHRIAPLILLPFIENCFKHGASKDRMSPSIQISLDIDPGFLYLKVVNSVPDVKNSAEPRNDGIGLKNVKRRLELIYPGQHELLIYPGDTLYTVECKIFWKK